MIYNENSFWELAMCSETPPGLNMVRGHTSVVIKVPCNDCEGELRASCHHTQVVLKIMNRDSNDGDQTRPIYHCKLYYCKEKQITLGLSMRNTSWARIIFYCLPDKLCTGLCFSCYAVMNIVLGGFIWVIFRDCLCNQMIFVVPVKWSTRVWGKRPIPNHHDTHKSRNIYSMCFYSAFGGADIACPINYCWCSRGRFGYNDIVTCFLINLE